MKKGEKYLRISLKVTSNSSVTKIENINGEIKIKVKSSPVKEKANKELIEFLSKIFSIPKSNVIIEKGKTSKNKLVKLVGISEKEFNELLKIDR